MTSQHVQNACRGNAESLTWIVRRFSPLLHAQARLRIARGLQDHYSPEDLVQDVWIVALTKLEALDLPGIDDSQRVLAFLGRTLLNLYGNLLQKHLSGKALRWRPNTSDAASGLDFLPAEASGAITNIIRQEQRDSLSVAMDELSDTDRELIIMRAMEQIPNAVVAQQLGIEPNTLSARYHRALERLAKKVPSSVIADLRAS